MLKKVLLALTLLLPAFMAQAKDIQVLQPWSQELPPNAPTVAAYFTLRNDGNTADRLLSVESPIAGSAEIHQHMDSDGMMKMAPVEAVNIGAGEQATFQPMGYHVMLINLSDRSQLQDGGHFPLTLHFKQAGDITVQVVVMKQPPVANP
ncbi:copper chaperone PCu(A)C [Pseudomonas putida]